MCLFQVDTDTEQALLSFKEYKFILEELCGLYTLKQGLEAVHYLQVKGKQTRI